MSWVVADVLHLPANQAGTFTAPAVQAAVDIDREIGLPLPCTVVHADGPDHILVQALDPRTWSRSPDVPRSTR